MSNRGSKGHPSRVPGRTKFLVNLDLQREQEKAEAARKKKKKGLTPNVRDLFKDL